MKSYKNNIISRAYLDGSENIYNSDKSRARNTKAYKEAMEWICSELGIAHDNEFTFEQLYGKGGVKVREKLDEYVKKFSILSFDYIDITDKLFNQFRDELVKTLPDEKKDEILSISGPESFSCHSDILIQDSYPAIQTKIGLPDNFFTFSKEDDLLKNISEFRNQEEEELKSKKNNLIDGLSRDQGFFSRIMESVFGPSTDKMTKITHIKGIQTIDQLDNYQLEEAKKDVIAKIEGSGFWQILKRLIIGGTSQEIKNKIEEVREINNMGDLIKYESQYDRESLGLGTENLIPYNNNTVQVMRVINNNHSQEMQPLINDPLKKITITNKKLIN